MEAAHVIESTRRLVKQSPATMGAVLEARYYTPHHVRHADQEIARALEAGGARIIITEPPRHGKSKLVSHYTPAWFLNRWPDRRVITACHTHELASHWGRLVRDTIEGNGFALDVEIDQRSRAAHRWDTTKGGGMFTVGVGAAVAGHGADLLDVDDPIPNAEHAASQIYRDKVWRWFCTDLHTRLSPTASILIVVTRWHDDDLVGRLTRGEVLEEEQEEFFEDVPPESWRVINLPALAEDDDELGRARGEALWPARFSRGWLLSKRQAVGAKPFASLYQGRPSPEQGDIFQSQNFRRYHRRDDLNYYLRPDPESERLVCYPPTVVAVVQTCDTAMKEKETSCRTAVMTFGITPARDVLVLDVAAARIAVPDQWAFIMAARAKWVRCGNWRWQGVEDKGSGTGLLQLAEKHGVAMLPLLAVQDKVTRATDAATFCRMGKLYLPENAPWLGDLEAELLAFPTGKWDDLVDCLAYAVREIAASKPLGYDIEDDDDELDEIEQATRLTGGGPETW